MQNLKAVTAGVVASIEFVWSIMANPAMTTKLEVKSSTVEFPDC
jgi:hypothetical protein